MKVTANFDGGSRGNPGPAAAATVIRDATGTVIDEAAEPLGSGTNNFAEYRALLLALDRAAALGATEVDLIGDSELIIKQVRGEYKVKHPELKPLHAEAKARLQNFSSWTATAVRRAENYEADALVNQALDAHA